MVDLLRRELLASLLAVAIRCERRPFKEQHYPCR